MRECTVSGLRIASRLALPGVPVSGPLIGGPPVEIDTEDPGAPPADARAASPILHVAGSTAWFDVPGLRCRIGEGRRVSIGLPPGAPTGDIAGTLLGPALAVVCHQRGLLPLHASSIQVDGGCVVFVGRAYAGKSAVAAALCGRGHALVADDLCVIQLDERGVPMVFPGTPFLRLSRETMAGLGRPVEQIAQVRPGVEKLLIPARLSERALPVRHVVVIDADERAGSAVDRRIGLDAISVIVASTWHVRAVRAFGNAATHFAQCAAVAERAAIWRWSRPHGVRLLPGALAGLEAAWRAVDRSIR